MTHNMQYKSFVFNFLEENTYILWDQTGQAAIIDPGMYTAQEEQILDAFVKENNLDVKLLLNSHLHFDHVFGNPYVCKRYGIAPWANGGDKVWLEDIKKMLGKMGFRLETEQPAIAHMLQDGEIVRFGNTELKCIFVPGHSAGCMAFYCEQEQLLFSGDILFRGSVGRTDFPDSSHSLQVEGIHNKLFVLPEQTTVCPGHGPSTTIGYELDNNCIA